MKRALLGGRRVSTPVFAATVADNQRLWSWRRGVRPEALLISYDVLGGRRARTNVPLAETLAFDGLLIVDSGGYGTSSETDPGAVYRLQRAIGANVGVVLDKLPSALDSSRAQWASVRQTVANARRIHRRHRRGMSLEAVVQGVTPAQRQLCGSQLGTIGFDVYGVPVSAQARFRRYLSAVERFTQSVAAVPVGAQIHALGCGSRSLIAILSALGATIFDSRSYYQRAMYGENLAPVTMCAIGAPRSKPACDGCLDRRRPGRTLEGRTDYNLNEILKEMTRVRCALEASAMPSYLERRLGKRLFGQIAPSIAQGQRRRLPIVREKLG
jgi:queuine/archaeosine tRNA-ribosyltransferase